ncbi:D-isomer specific 2-hydroxyacid dehydrogenase [Tribonema minus]|uniref:D-isomer specific 2-hydroxyacid dehydrogenase n=1 Tax=Tribonema minus TaxID=303371 RepID=A0A835YMI0_9STRA|nr:D-isomer specific 2-hydroxyacid dehydrogenase [Tribonema minus]
MQRIPRSLLLCVFMVPLLRVADSFAAPPPLQNTRIVVLDGFTSDQGSPEVWSECLGHPATVYARTSPDLVLKRIGDAQAVLTSKVVIDEPVMDACKQLQYVGVTATGYNMVDLDAARKRGIAVTHVPVYSTASVAQMVAAYLTHDASAVSALAATARDHWPHALDFCSLSHPMTELAGKRLALVGRGAIGAAVARIAEAFEMEVLWAQLPGREPKPDSVPLRNALAKADYVSLHVPLAEETQAMVNVDFLRAMQPGAVLINTARGGLLDEDAVAAALDSGLLRRAYLDVLLQEPPATLSSSLRLLRHARAVVTPHAAWGTREARRRCVEASAANVRAWAAGERLNRLC